jgi:hypothetical protein
MTTLAIDPGSNIRAALIDCIGPGTLEAGL